MNPLANGFDKSAKVAATLCNCGVQKLKRSFGLDDFLTNTIQDDDDAPTIAVKALDYFCDEWDPLAEKCKVAVVAIGIFLNGYHAKRTFSVPQQPLRDLVSILNSSTDQETIRKWIDSNFG